MNTFVLVWLLFLPIIHFWEVYEGTKIMYFWGGSLVLSVYWVVHIVRSSHIPIEKSDFFYLLWIVLLLLSSILGVHAADSIVGGSYRHQGVLFFLSLYAVLLTLRSQKFFSSVTVQTLLALTVVYESVIIIFERLGSPNIRSVGTIGEPNAAGGFIMIGIYWILLLKIPVKIRIGLLAVCLAAIIATESRISILLASFLLVYTAFRKLRVPTRFRIYFIVIPIGAFMVVSILRYTRTHVFDIVRGPTNYESRNVIWNYALKAIQRKPVFGYGAESGEDVFTRGYAYDSIKLHNFMVDRSHNLFLDIAMWTGIPGLLLFIYWLYTLFRDSWDKGKNTRFAFQCAFLIFALLQPLSVVHWVLFFLLRVT